jgi:hypothetical protein
MGTEAHLSPFSTKGTSMPLKLNVGLSRKVADNNYGSRGASVNVELEVESALAADPVKLRERIRQVFGLVRDSLVEELNSAASGQPRSNGQTQAPANAARSDNGQRSSTPRPATQSQVRAIAAIARRLQINLDDLLGQFHARRAQDLSIKQASQLIDELKSKQEGG